MLSGDDAKTGLGGATGSSVNATRVIAGAGELDEEPGERMDGALSTWREGGKGGLERAESDGSMESVSTVTIDEKKMADGTNLKIGALNSRHLTLGAMSRAVNHLEMTEWHAVHTPQVEANRLQTADLIYRADRQFPFAHALAAFANNSLVLLILHRKPLFVRRAAQCAAESWKARLLPGASKNILDCTPCTLKHIPWIDGSMTFSGRFPNPECHIRTFEPEYSTLNPKH
jgi:hypothetical protein